MGPFLGTWSPLFSPRGGQEGQEGSQKGCPNLGSILSPKMAPKGGGVNSRFGLPGSSGACPNPLQAKFAAGTLRDLNFHRFGLQNVSILEPIWATRNREKKNLQLQVPCTSAPHCSKLIERLQARMKHKAPREAALPRRKASWIKMG